MKRVLLISNYVFHYRQKVYSYFADRFKEDGYEFHVLSNGYQEAGYIPGFIKHEIPFTVRGYLAKIDDINPDTVIVFLHLKDLIQLPVIYHCKKRHIHVIFWNKGVSDCDPNNPVKNLFYHHIHTLCDALITYTPEMRSNFQKKNHKKLFVAYNTVDCTDIDKSKYDPAEIRKKYGIKEDKVVLYVSRLKRSKHIEWLLQAMANEPGIAVAAMGAGMTPEFQEIFDSAPNLYYFGQVYGEESAEIWAMGDVFSIPVSCGLGINEAIFWGMPTVTTDGFQPPEIYYLKEGKTGIIAHSREEYQQKLLSLLHDDNKLEYMRQECQKEYEAEVRVDRMYQGFIDAVSYCQENGGRKREHC